MQSCLLTDVHYVALLVDHDVAVVPVLDLQQEPDDAVRRHRRREGPASPLESLLGEDRTMTALTASEGHFFPYKFKVTFRYRKSTYTASRKNDEKGQWKEIISRVGTVNRL